METASSETRTGNDLMKKQKYSNSPWISLIAHSQADKTSGFKSCFLGREWLNFSLHDVFPRALPWQKLFCLETSNDVAKDDPFGWFVAAFHTHTGIKDTEKSFH